MSEPLIKVGMTREHWLDYYIASWREWSLGQYGDADLRPIHEQMWDDLIQPLLDSGKAVFSQEPTPSWPDDENPVTRKMISAGMQRLKQAGVNPSPQLVSDVYWLMMRATEKPFPEGSGDQ